MPSQRPFDLAVIGGGIVGLATAWHYLQRAPKARVAILEKESDVARHQTGRNSGVIHSGIYYAPGSAKAAMCVAGARRMVQFCAEQGIPHRICGKVIVATSEEELPRLEELFRRAAANGVVAEKLGPEQLREIEPAAAGIAALFVKDTGVVDYAEIARRLAVLLQDAGASLLLGHEVHEVRAGNSGVTIVSTRADVNARHLVSCAGLHSDKVAQMTGADVPCQIIPFRGEYYSLRPERASLVRTLIYPVPDPAFPFLGVHLTRGIDGSVHAGPNAVLAFRREGYSRNDVHLAELMEALTYPGFLRLASKHWRSGAAEMARSFSKSKFVASLQRLVPEVREEDVEPAPAGVRAQAVLPNGKLVDDFLFTRTAHCTFVLNAPSPAATASLELGRAIAEDLPLPTSTIQPVTA